MVPLLYFVNYVYIHTHILINAIL